MSDTTQTQTTIKHIIFWLRLIDDYNEVIKFMQVNNATGKFVVKPKTLIAKITSRIGCTREIELSDEVLSRLYTDFKEYVKHLEGLVDESDPQLVEVAKGVYTGEITPKGFEFR